jgi:UDP-3-O-[3-hydroxymyristoyl] glucosamine N-acyltransferase
VTSFRLSEIAATIGAILEGEGDPEITGVAGIREALPGQITFLANPRYRSYAPETRASAMIVSADYIPEGSCRLLRADDPYMAYLKVLRLFGADRPRVAPGIHPTAVIGEDVRMGAHVSIGAHAVIEAGATLGDRVTLMPGLFIGSGVTIGDDTFMYPNVTIRENCRIGRNVTIHSGAVIGSDGFGYAREGETLRKIPQLGTVIVEDDVEIGANVTIDRATTGATHIGAGVRIDNLVQIAHNVTIGENSVICAQVGISGSTEIGRNVTLAGQAGVVGHIKIGEGAQVGAQAGVTKSEPAGVRVSGYPATEHDQALRIQAHTRKLPELTQAVKDLRQKLAELERELEKAREQVL